MNTTKLFFLAIAFPVACIWLPVTSFAEDIDTYFRRFNAAMDAENHVEAERYARLMLSSSSVASWRAASLNSLGRACRANKKYDESERAFLQALAIPLAADNSNNGWIPNNLALLYNSKKRFAEAEAMLHRALTFFERTEGAISGPVAMVYSNFAQVNHDRENYKEAERYAQKCYSIRRAVFGAEHATIAKSLGNIADMHRHMKNWDESKKYFDQALAMRKKLFGAESEKVADTYDSIATMHREAENYSAAEQADREALRLREKLFGPKHPDVKSSLDGLATDLERQDRKDEAATFRDRAAQLEADIAHPPRPNRVEIVAATASAMLGTQVIASVRQGQQYYVSEVEGKWYKLKMTIAGEEKGGWVQDRDIRVVGYTSHTPAAGAKTWHTFLPPQGKFTAKFPGSPLNRKLSAGGLESTNFRVELDDAAYEVFYFDLPTGRTLPIDQAANSIANMLKGKVKSQTTIERDLYPGREVLIEKEGNAMTRLQMLNVGRRWYVVTVEGTASSVNGDDANRFLNSFALAD